MSWLTAAAVAAGAGFVAELGDKSQLLAAGLAARYRRRTLLAGVALAVVAVQAVAVLAGATLGRVLPDLALGLVAAVLFAGVGAWLWLAAPSPAPPPEEPAPLESPSPAGLPDEGSGPAGSAVAPASTVTAGRPAGGTWGVLVVAGAFAVGELGDKTQLTTLALAARQDPLATLVGGVVGVLAANVLAIEVGLALARALPPRTFRRVAAALFVVAGVVLAVLTLTTT